jgi:hypothetical protein
MTDSSTEDTRSWDKNDTWGVVFFIPAMLLAVWGFASPHSVGWSIGTLTLVAAAASIRLDMKGMKGPERVAWIVVFSILTYQEYAAIDRNDKQNIADRQAQNEQNLGDRKAQNEHFEAITKELTDSLTTSRTQYKSTITHVDGVLKTTRSVASLAKENLENLTGADTYAYVVPDPFGIPRNEVGFMIYSKGPNTLTGITVRIENVPGFFRDPEHLHFLKDAIVEDVGTLHHSGQRRLKATIKPQVDPARDTLDWWQVDIDSQNATIRETVEVKKGTGQSPWVWRYRVEQIWVPGPCPKGVSSGNAPNNECFKEVLLKDWTGWSSIRNP